MSKYGVYGKNLVDRDGELYLMKQYFRQVEADDLFAVLLHDLSWHQETIFIYGRPVKVPRLMCWYGDSDAVYSYSGVSHEPLPWTTELSAIRRKIESDCAISFNSVLANLYRDGQDSMGFHADKEKDLGVNPVIASLSLGDDRLFRLIHNKTKEKLDLTLGHGDLLIMAGSLQHNWRHGIPKTRQQKSARINLTFRKIIRLDSGTN